MLCPTLHDVREHGVHAPCLYGDKCRYMHDTANFMATKLPDVGDSCHVFDTFGVCLYGPACRFATSHLTEDFLNVTKDSHKESKFIQETVCNTLSKGLQFDLRKRRVKFEQTESYLKKLGHKKSCDGNNGGILKGGTGKAVKEEARGLVEGGVSGETEDSVAIRLQVLEEEARGMGEGGVSGETEDSVAIRLQVLEEEAGMGGVNVAGGEIDLSECKGAVTDEGVVKLRASEKKRVDFMGKLYLAPLTTVSQEVTCRCGLFKKYYLFKDEARSFPLKTLDLLPCVFSCDCSVLDCVQVS